MDNAERLFGPLGNGNPSMRLGGQGYLYTEQDWSDSPEALSDALLETAEAARHHLAEAISYYRGLQALCRHANPSSLAVLAAEYPFMATLLARPERLLFPQRAATAMATRGVVTPS